MGVREDGRVVECPQSDALKAQILAKQQPDGGLSLGSLGQFSRKGVKDESKTSDGYATGLILHVLQVAGVAKEDARVKKGLLWLRASQDKSGPWRAASVNKNRRRSRATRARRISASSCGTRRRRIRCWRLGIELKMPVAAGCSLAVAWRIRKNEHGAGNCCQSFGGSARTAGIRAWRVVALH